MDLSSDLDLFLCFHDNLILDLGLDLDLFLLPDLSFFIKLCGLCLVPDFDLLLCDFSRVFPDFDLLLSDSSPFLLDFGFFLLTDLSFFMTLCGLCLVLDLDLFSWFVPDSDSPLFLDFDLDFDPLRPTFLHDLDHDIDRLLSDRGSCFELSLDLFFLDFRRNLLLLDRFRLDEADSCFDSGLVSCGLGATSSVLGNLLLDCFRLDEGDSCFDSCDLGTTSSVLGVSCCGVLDDGSCGVLGGWLFGVG